MTSIQSSSKKRKNKGLGDNNKRKKKHQDLSDVRKLGEQLLSSRAHINNLPLLLNFLDLKSSYPREFLLESLLSLQSFFTPLLPQLPSSSAKPTEDPESIYQTWVRSKFDDFVQCLIQLALSPSLDEEALRVSTFNLYLSIFTNLWSVILVEWCGISGSGDGYFDGVCEGWKCRDLSFFYIP